MQAKPLCINQGDHPPRLQSKPLDGQQVEPALAKLENDQGP
jgi:hypothetical protein